MKKILLISFFISGTIFTQAQVCTPDNNCQTGICPDTVVNLPDAYVNVYYDTPMTIVVPNDTTFTLQGQQATFKFDSVIFENYQLPDLNLPSGLNVYCDNPNNPNSPCTFYGNTKDCMSIKGTVTSINDTGLYDLSVKTRAYLSCLSPSFICGFVPKIDTAIIFNGYHINVLAGVNVKELENLGFSLSQNNPNPVNDKTTIRFISPVKYNYTFKVYNILGEIVESKIIAAKPGENNIVFNGSNLESGIYTYSITDGKNVSSRRMIVANEVR